MPVEPISAVIIFSLGMYFFASSVIEIVRWIRDLNKY